jgi:hypothetical protein
MQSQYGNKLKNKNKTINRLIMSIMLEIIKDRSFKVIKVKFLIMEIIRRVIYGKINKNNIKTINNLSNQLQKILR